MIQTVEAKAQIRAFQRHEHPVELAESLSVRNE